LGLFGGINTDIHPRRYAPERYAASRGFSAIDHTIQYNTITMTVFSAPYTRNRTGGITIVFCQCLMWICIG